MRTHAEQLSLDRRPAAVPREHGHCCRHEPAGRYAAHANAIRVGAQRVGVGHGPHEGGVSVLDAERVLVLGREAVLDGDHHGVGGVLGKCVSDRIVRATEHLRARQVARRVSTQHGARTQKPRTMPPP